jgi:hypothetical protein
LDGFARGGWKVVYRDKPGELRQARYIDNILDLTSSIGLLLKDAG